MQVTNEDVAANFELESKLLALERANPFRVRAYRNAAETIRRLRRPLSSMLADGKDLTELPTIGKGIADQIEEILVTGTSSKLSAAERRVSPGLVELLEIPGLGPVGVGKLHRLLGINTRSDLERALRKHRVAKLPGFGPATEQRLLAEIARLPSDNSRMLLSEAIAAAKPLLKFLRSRGAVDKATACGSLRRGKPTVGDLDIVLVSRTPEKALREAATYSEIDMIVSEGSTRSTYRLVDGIQVDIRAVHADEAGAALLYFTGNKAHNITLRRRAKDLGHKLNEYGLFDRERRIAGDSELSIYTKLGLQYVPPELRHGTDELQRAEANLIPTLIECGDVNGDLHVMLPRRQSAQLALVKELYELNYGFVGLVQPWRFDGRGADKQADEIRTIFRSLDYAAEKTDTPTIFKGLEVALPRSGEIEVPQDLLKECDYLIASVESDLTLSRSRQTTRLLTAMEHPMTKLLSHPTSRDLRRFVGLSLDLERVFAKAVDDNCWLEISGDPQRLDLPSVHCRSAARAGVTLCLGSGASTARQSVERLRYAVTVARRGWLRSSDVINCTMLESIPVE
jgi:DNA polymerase (family 10)